MTEENKETTQVIHRKTRFPLMIYVPKTMIQRMRDEAKQRGLSVSGLCNLMFHDWLEEHSKQKPIESIPKSSCNVQEFYQKDEVKDRSITNDSNKTLDEELDELLKKLKELEEKEGTK